MNINSVHIKNIIKANNDNSLAIFVGSGISKTSETKSLILPNWNDLIVDFKKELSIDGETDFLKIAQLYFLEFGEYSYYKKIKSYFPDYISPSDVHKLIFEIKPHIVITTNWDNILERSIEDNAFIYDVISSDNDLVKSSLQNKLVKMHGDFKNHNLVFKEDDYINYKFNFPLIENYIKSIISTHTILFLGYSYNDIDLKHIVKWIQNYSKVRHPMYLATTKKNKSQEKYLENFGITSLILNEGTKDNLEVAEYSKLHLDLLLRIKTFDENSIISSDEETIDFVYNKLILLNDLNSILIQQLQNSLSNCSFIYDDYSNPILKFEFKFLTGDINKSIRSIYRKFVDILVRIDEKNYQITEKIVKIFQILARANIKGIVLSDDELKNNGYSYLPFSEYIHDNEDVLSLDLNFSNLSSSQKSIYDLLDSAFSKYKLELFEESYDLIEEMIVLCLKQKNFTLLFIGMFNKNILLLRLKYNSDSITRAKFSQIEKYNLKEKFNSLPRDLQLALEPLYEFLNYNYLNRLSYSVTDDVRKKKDSKKTIESGGFVFNSDVNELNAKHKNLNSFVLNNKIFIEDDSLYKFINKSYIEIALIRQVLKEKTSLNKVELYSCICHFKNKELRELLEEFYQFDSQNKGNFELIEEQKDWLLNVIFKNLTQEFLKAKVFSKFEDYIENTLFILSICKLSSKEINSILISIDYILSRKNNSIGMLDSINSFFGIQFNLYEPKMDGDKLIELIEKLINKIVYRDFNGHEFTVISRNRIRNLYGYARESKIVYKNLTLINKLILEMNDLDICDRLNLSESLLLSIYEISDKKIKEIIKAFMLNLNIENEKIEVEERIIFKLTLATNNFKKFEQKDIVELNDFFEQYEDGKRFSSLIYTIDDQINYLIKHKKYLSLTTISTKIKKSIELHEKSKSFSYF